MRDIEKQPYSPDEARVAKFFVDAGVGGGDDPIGTILASHAYAAAQRNRLREALERGKGTIQVLAKRLPPGDFAAQGIVSEELTLIVAALKE